MPVPRGTLVEVEMFNGVRRTFFTGAAVFDPEGTPISADRSAGWSGWIYEDGGPMGVKFRRYRLIGQSYGEYAETALLPA